MNRTRYTVDEVLKPRFYQMPKFLFGGEFKKMSNDAKILYALLKDRHELSLSNNWVNDDNEVYLIMPREEMCELLGVSQPTIRKAINQLIDFGLMEEVRQGLNKPNIIYLMECKNFSHQTKKENYSDMKKNYSPNGKKVSPNDTDVNKTDKNDTDLIDEALKPSSSQKKQISKWLTTGIALELLNKALAICLEGGTETTNFRYFKGIISNFIKNNIHTVADYEKHENNRSKPYTKNNYNKQNVFNSDAYDYDAIEKLAAEKLIAKFATN